MNPSTIDPMLIQEIHAVITRKIPEWFGAGAVLHGNPVIEKRSWSYLIQYSIQSTGNPEIKIYLKISRRPEIETLETAIHTDFLRQKSIDEYENMLAVRDVFFPFRDEFCFINPLAYLPEYNAVVMEELPSQPIKDFLISPRISLGFRADWDRLLKIFFKAAQWLRIYHHQVGKPQNLPIDIELLDGIARTEFERLQKAVQDEVDLSELEHCLKQMLAMLDQERPKCMVTTLHSDFNCANVLVDQNGRVGALDVGFKEGLIYEDLAKLITDPATRKEQVLSRGAVIRPRQLRRIQEAIFNGYFGEYPVHIGLLNFYSVTTIMRKWAMNEDEFRNGNRYPGWAKRLLRQQMRSYFQDILRKYLCQVIG